MLATSSFQLQLKSISHWSIVAESVKQMTVKAGLMESMITTEASRKHGDSNGRINMDILACALRHVVYLGVIGLKLSQAIF